MLECAREPIHIQYSHSLNIMVGIGSLLHDAHFCLYSCRPIRRFKRWAEWWVFELSHPAIFSARDVIYTSRAYATMSVSVCLSVTGVHWRIIVNLGFKFRSKFTAHCGRGACGLEHWTVYSSVGAREGIIAGKSGGIISLYASLCYALLFLLGIMVLIFIYIFNCLLQALRL